MSEATVLRSAMKGAGTDEEVIIRVASSHNFLERAQIAQAFCGMFGLELHRELKRELSGNIERLMMGAFMNRYDYWAMAINECIAGAGTDEMTLIQLIILMSDQDAVYVNQSYMRMFSKDMFRDIQNDTGLNTNWGRLLRSWLMATNAVPMNPE